MSRRAGKSANFYGETTTTLLPTNMTELKEAGYISNRGRQSVADYLVRTLGVDWRLGASWFKRFLLDYGNWNFQAGIGHDLKM